MGLDAALAPQVLMFKDEVSCPICKEILDVSPTVLFLVFIIHSQGALRSSMLPRSHVPELLYGDARTFRRVPSVPEIQVHRPQGANHVDVPREVPARLQPLPLDRTICPVRRTQKELPPRTAVRTLRRPHEREWIWTPHEVHPRTPEKARLGDLQAFLLAPPGHGGEGLFPNAARFQPRFRQPLLHEQSQRKHLQKRQFEGTLWTHSGIFKT